MHQSFSKEYSNGDFDWRVPKNWKISSSPLSRKSGENSPALWTNLEIFLGEPLLGEFVENVCHYCFKKSTCKPKIGSLYSNHE